MECNCLCSNNSARNQKLDICKYVCANSFIFEMIPVYMHENYVYYLF